MVSEMLGLHEPLVLLGLADGQVAGVLELGHWVFRSLMIVFGGHISSQPSALVFYFAI
jgi:hypothetical protein